MLTKHWASLNEAVKAWACKLQGRTNECIGPWGKVMGEHPLHPLSILMKL